MSKPNLETPHSYTLESRCLGSLLQYGETLWPQVESFLDKDCFYDVYNKANSTVFSVIKTFLDSGKKPEAVIIAEKISSLGIQFEDTTPFDYLDSLASIQISELGAIEAAKELVQIKVRRQLFLCLKNQAIYVVKEGSSHSIDEIIGNCDNKYAELVKVYSEGKNEPKNLADDIENIVNDYAKEQKEEPGLITPWPKFNEQFGGLQLRQTYAFAGRSGAGKSSVMDDLAFTTANLISQIGVIGQESLPVVKIDTEMRAEEIRLRVLSRLSGVPVYYIQTGKFSKNKELYDKVLAATKVFNKCAYHHIYSPSMDIKEICHIIKRWAWKNVGRNGPFILVWDYVKLQGEKLDSSNNSYIALGRKMDIMNELVKDHLNCALLFGVQRNRSGTDNKFRPADDTENSFGDSDLLNRVCSFSSIIKEKNVDDLLEFPAERWGSHKLIPAKVGRVAGIKGYKKYIKINGKFEQNFINLNIDLFHVTERGGAEEVKAWVESSPAASSGQNRDNTII